MKKLIVFLVLTFCVSVFPQKTFYEYLQNTYDSTTAANYDTLVVFDLNRYYEQSNLIVENVGSVPCTLSVSGVSYVRNADQWSLKQPAAVTDTVFYVIPINSDAGANVTTFIVANGATILYELKKPFLDGVRVYITQNAGGKVNLFLETGKL